MKKISAWLQIDVNGLLDLASSMIFQTSRSGMDWIPIILSEGDSASATPPMAFSSPRSIIVRFELPGGMACVVHERPDEIALVSEVFDSRETDSHSGTQQAWVSFLPAIFAREVLLANEDVAREVESHLKLLAKERMNWASLRVIEKELIRSSSHERGPGPDKRQVPASNPSKLEKLASSIGTAIIFGRSDIGNGRAVTFDTGTVALLRKMLSGEPGIPEQKTLVTETKRLIKELFAVARSKGLKPGAAPKKIDTVEIGALQLAYLLDNGVTHDDDLFQAHLDKNSEGRRTIDQRILETVLRHLIEEKEFPTIADVLSILDQVAKELDAGPGRESTDRHTIHEALQILIANVESSEDPIADFRNRFGQLPGITGIAHVFWGWSAKPLDNFEQRVQPLKSMSRNAYQIANIVFSAAVGGGGLPDRYLKSRLWRTAYESAWALLLVNTDIERTGKEEFWALERGGLKHGDSGPLVEITVGDRRIPLGLQISDAVLMVQTLAMERLNSERFRESAANAILIALDGDTSRLSAELKGLHEISLTVRLRKNLTGEIQGASIHFSKVKGADLTFEHHWADPSEAARKLTESKLLSKILAALPKERLEKLRLELTDRSEHQSS